MEIEQAKKIGKIYKRFHDSVEMMEHVQGIIDISMGNKFVSVQNILIRKEKDRAAFTIIINGLRDHKNYHERKAQKYADEIKLLQANNIT